MMNISGIGDKIKGFLEKNAEIIGYGIPILAVGQEKNWDLNRIFNITAFQPMRGLAVISPQLGGGYQPSPALQNTFKAGIALWLGGEFLGFHTAKTIGKNAAIASVVMGMIDPEPGESGGSGGSGGSSPGGSYGY